MPKTFCKRNLLNWAEKYMRHTNTQNKMHIGHTERIFGFGVFEPPRRMERVLQARQTKRSQSSRSMD